MNVSFLDVLFCCKQLDLQLDKMGDDSFRKALERFRASLTSDEDDEFRFTKLEDVHVAIHAVQAEHGPRKSMPNLNRIKGFLEAMKQLEEVLKIFLNVSGMVAFIWVQSFLLYQP